MSYDGHYSQLYGLEENRAPIVNDMDGLMEALQSFHERFAKNAEFREYRDESTYPASVYKQLLGFKFYGDDDYVIPDIGFDENFVDTSTEFLDLWTTISEYTEPFYVWYAPTGSLPLTRRIEEFDQEKKLYRVECDNGEISIGKHVFARQHTESVPLNDADV